MKLLLIRNREGEIRPQTQFVQHLRGFAHFRRTTDAVLMHALRHVDRKLLPVDGREGRAEAREHFRFDAPAFRRFRAVDDQGLRGL